MNSNSNQSLSLLSDHPSQTLTFAGRKNPFFPATSSSSIPFSWERLPGIPKSPAGPTPLRPDKSFPAGDRISLLPLPPPLKSKRHVAAFDPFAAALAACAKDVSDADAIWWRRSDESGGTVGKMAAIFRRSFMVDRTGCLELFGSLNCKTACSVIDAAIAVPRSRVRLPDCVGRCTGGRSQIWGCKEYP